MDFDDGEPCDDAPALQPMPLDEGPFFRWLMATIDRALEHRDDDVEPTLH